MQHRDVLHVAPKGQTDAALALSAREDALLRAAFGRYGGSVLARRAAAAIVQHHQQIGRGDGFSATAVPTRRVRLFWCRWLRMR